MIFLHIAGDLHIGHAMNKILKDFIVKHQLLQGKRVSYIPGWDCHGLPIELKVLQSLKSKEVRLRHSVAPVHRNHSLTLLGLSF